ncbi:MAG: histidinol-phosphate transaminase [Planctomycetota bacterium]|nr:histidinol-phosphate transaminase [Planctomycetota bacterium]
MGTTKDDTGVLEPVPALRDVRPYRVPRTSVPVRLALDGNEGLRPPAALLDRLPGVGEVALRRYPSARELEERIAARMGVDPAQVLVTAGADDALDRAMRASLCPGRELVLPSPSFEMIERYARLAGADVVRVPWSADPWPLDGLLRALTARTGCIAIVSPNNPTGLEASLDDLRRVADAAPRAVIVVDQAYAEFGDVDFAASVRATPNAVLVRSLSKAFGLAGLRVGYAVGAARVIGWLRAAGQPYAVSGPSLAIAAARFELPVGDVTDFVARVRSERERLEVIACDLGFTALPSKANFVLVRSPDAARIWERLAALGIAVRAFPGKIGLENALRITCPGDETAFQELVAGLRAAVGPDGGIAGGAR